MLDMAEVFTAKTLWMLANIICLAFLAIQLANVLQSSIKPTITRTWEEEVLRQDIEFPAVIKVCVVPGFNRTALHEAGYWDTWTYFLGQSMFNHSVYGWAGHTEDSGTLGNVEDILARVKDYQIERIFNYVYLWTKDDERIYIPFEQLKASRVNYPNNCRSLNLSSIPELRGKHFMELILDVNELGDYAVEVQLQGDTLDCNRNIKEHSLHSSGDAIRLNVENVWKAYMLDITQRVFVEDDPTNTCRDYPNKEYLSFKQCDDQFVRNLLPGLTSVWMTDNYSEVSTQVFDENGTFGELL